MKTSTSSLRQHPELRSMFKNIEGRDPTDEELNLYSQVLPEKTVIADAARAARKVEGSISRKVIKTIFAIYPYEAHHQMATAKAVRDVRYVISYAILSMLMDDLQWYRDKLLIWMKTIIQSFEYPKLPDGKKNLFPEEKEKVLSLRGGQQSIHECYLMVEREMEAALDREHYEAIQPFLSEATRILAND